MSHCIVFQTKEQNKAWTSDIYKDYTAEIPHSSNNEFIETFRDSKRCQNEGGIEKS